MSRRRCAVLILSGSSGRLETERARVLAEQGAAVLPFQHFGVPGRPAELSEIPLESFTPALDELAAQSEHLAVLGLSKGAEAALLLATRDPRVTAVAALSPTPVVWAGLSGDFATSSWSEAGKSLPFVPYDKTWTGDAGAVGPVEYKGLYQQSLRTFADRVEAATIPVERITGRVLLTAGADDKLWPAAAFVTAIADRRAAHHLRTEVLIDPLAGHRLRFPGEQPVAPSTRLAHGGTPEADAAFGSRVWPRLLELLNLRDTGE
jgi:acetyl esterase/lipase